jgi:hypothetical protein
MAVEGTRWTKNPKTRQTRELFDQEEGRVELMWMPSHSGITRYKRADETDAKHKQKHLEIQKGNYRVEGRIKQPNVWIIKLRISTFRITEN